MIRSQVTHLTQITGQVTPLKHNDNNRLSINSYLGYFTFTKTIEKYIIKDFCHNQLTQLTILSQNNKCQTITRVTWVGTWGLL